MLWAKMISFEESTRNSTAIIIIQSAFEGFQVLLSLGILITT